jgi:sec-independent protein translocase protein TatA
MQRRGATSRSLDVADEEASMFGLGTGEILLILVILVVLFGAKKIPQLGEALGKGIRSFRKATDNGIVDGPQEKGPPSLEANTRSVAPGARAPDAAEKKA